jgi:hypothetical protein
MNKPALNPISPRFKVEAIGEAYQRRLVDKPTSVGHSQARSIATAPPRALRMSANRRKS